MGPVDWSSDWRAGCSCRGAHAAAGPANKSTARESKQAPPSPKCIVPLTRAGLPLLLSPARTRRPVSCRVQCFTLGPAPPPSCRQPDRWEFLVSRLRQMPVLSVRCGPRRSVQDVKGRRCVVLCRGDWRGQRACERQRWAWVVGAIPRASPLWGVAFLSGFMSGIPAAFPSSLPHCRSRVNPAAASAHPPSLPAPLCPVASSVLAFLAMRLSCRPF